MSWEMVSPSGVFGHVGRVGLNTRKLRQVRAVLAIATLVMGGLLIAIMLMSERSSGRQSVRRRRWFTGLAVIMGVSWLFLAAIVAGIVGPSE